MTAALAGIGCGSTAGAGTAGPTSTTAATASAQERDCALLVALHESTTPPGNEGAIRQNIVDYIALLRSTAEAVSDAELRDVLARRANLIEALFDADTSGRVDFVTLIMDGRNEPLVLREAEWQKNHC